MKKEKDWLNILHDAFDLNKWGHWASLNGLYLVFDVQDKEKFQFKKAMKQITNKIKITRVINSFGNTPASTFFYIPMFNEPYWEKVVEVRKKIPLVKHGLHHLGEYTNEHCYEMLLHQDWIPNWSEMFIYRGVDERLIPFDYDYYEKRFVDEADNYKSRKVRCVETGEVWSSINEAADKLNINYNSLYSHIKNKKTDRGLKPYHGYHFQLV